MHNSSLTDYLLFDRPEIVSFLFHPRPDYAEAGKSPDILEMVIPVERDISIGAKWHTAGPSDPVILFFHGNGEIVSDCDELGRIYSGTGISFLAVDYRGYGRSTGSPTVSNMMGDCHAIFDYVKNELNKKGYAGSLIVMGRSLGSASAIELAVSHEDEIDGLIIESGFASFIPLLQTIGVNTHALGIQDQNALQHTVKIQPFKKPVLLIHAEQDHIIPFSDAEALFESCQSTEKALIKIPEADHNTIFAKGMDVYMKGIKSLCEKVNDQKGREK